MNEWITEKNQIKNRKNDKNGKIFQQSILLPFEGTEIGVETVIDDFRLRSVEIEFVNGNWELELLLLLLLELLFSLFVCVVWRGVCVLSIILSSSEDTSSE